LKFFVPALLIAAMLAGCTKDAPHEDAAAKADVSLETDTILDLCLYNTDTLNPLVTSVKQNAEVLSCLYDSLFILKDDFSAEPDVCASCHFSDDGLTFYAEIKDGVFFQNGKELTARDVSMSVQRILESDGYYKSRLSCVMSADVVGNTLRLTLLHPSPNLPRLLDFPILPEGGFSVTGSVLLPPAPGSGLFLLSDYRVGEKLCLTANDAHHSGVLPYFEQAVIHLADNRETAYNMLESGTVDVLTKEEEPLPQGFSETSYTGCRFVFLGVGEKNVADIARAHINTSAFLPEDAEPSFVPLHPKAAQEPFATREATVSLEEVKNANAQSNAPPDVAGTQSDAPPDVAGTQSDASSDKVGQKTRLTLLYCETVAGRRAVAEGVLKNLTECGVSAEAVGVDKKEFSRRVAAGKYDLFLGEASLLPDFEDSPDAPYTVGLYFAAEHLMHDGGFLSVSVDTVNPFRSMGGWR